MLVIPLTELFLRYTFSGIKILFLILLFSPAFVQAQKKAKVRIEKADVLNFDQREGRNITKLTGNVALKQDSTYFYCDSAYLDNKSNNLFAFGHVHINYKDSVDVYGKYLEYEGDTKIATLDTNVKMIDSRATLYSEHLVYDRISSWAYYYTGGKIIDEENELTSIIGRYYTNTSEMFFKDSVVLINPDYTLLSDTLMYNTETEVVYIFGPTEIIGDEDYIYAERGWYDTQNGMTRLRQNARIVHLEQSMDADSIYYNRDSGSGNAYSNITLHDTLQNVMVKGNYAEFSREEGYSFVTDSAMAILIDNLDSLYLHADTLKVITDSADKASKLFAFYKMKFFREDMQGVCDSLVYDIKDSIIYMYRNPVLWSSRNQPGN